MLVKIVEIKRIGGIATIVVKANLHLYPAQEGELSNLHLGEAFLKQEVPPLKKEEVAP